MCWLYAYDPRYRALWDDAPPAIDPTECPHRSAPLLDSAGKPLTMLCAGCRGNVRLKVFQCDHPNVNRPVTLADCDKCQHKPTPMPHHHELTQTSPVEWVKTLLKQPPGPWPAQWEGFPNIIQAIQELFTEAAASVPAPPPFPIERGIVIAGGGWRFFPSIFVTVRMLRHVGCSLPIQVWYLGQGEFDPRMHQALEPYDVGWVDGHHQWATRPEMPIRRLTFDGDQPGWMLKPFAAAYSPFREVLFLDADSYPVYNPEIFMAHREYQRVGAAFFPDNNPLAPGQWERFGLPPTQTPALESGQFIVDKARHWKPLWLTCWLNAYYDFTYKHLYGDKDTFGIAWRKAGAEMCVPQQRPGWMRHTFLQKDFEGRVLFQHRTRDKFRFTGTIDGVGLEHRYMTRQQDAHRNSFEARLAFEQEAFDFLKHAEELIQPEKIFQFVGDGGSGRGWCRDIWDEVFLRNEYRLGREFLPEAVVIDVGAHVGAFARACLRRGASHVFCVEPLAVNVAALTHNLGDYGHERATILPQAIWDGAPDVPIGEDSCHVPGNTSTATVVSGQGTPVAATTLDAVIAAAAARAPSGRIDLLKIDAEGAEYPALLTAERLDLVDQLTGETHEGVLWRGEHHHSDEVFARLQSLGFAVSSTQNGPNTRLFWAKRATDAEDGNLVGHDEVQFSL
jgi:FkbM family methyltransferase